MKTAHQSLLEQLMDRSVRELMTVALHHCIEYPEGTDRFGQMKLINILEDKTSPHVDYYMDYADGGELWEEILPQLEKAREYAESHPFTPDTDSEDNHLSEDIGDEVDYDDELSEDIDDGDDYDYDYDYDYDDADGNDYDDGDEDDLSEEFEDEDSERFYHPEVIKYYDNIHSIGNQILQAIAEKAAAAEAVAEHLLDEDVLRKDLLYASDFTMELLRFAAGTPDEVPPRNGADSAGVSDFASARKDGADSTGKTSSAPQSCVSFWKDCHVDYHDRYTSSQLEEKGYVCFARRQATVNTEEQLISIEMVPEIAEMFHRIDTEEFNRMRVYRYWLSSCINMAHDYYEIPPVTLIYTLLQIVHDNVPDMLIPPPGDGFVKDISDALLYSDDYLKVIEEGGISYVLDWGMDDRDDPDGYVHARIQYYQDPDTDFYIPDFSEIAEYCRYGYWPSREPWQRLHTWLRYFYSDEQCMSNMFSSMVNAVHGMMDPESPDYIKPPYSKDNLEENAEEKLMLIKFDLMAGNSAEDCIENYDELVLGITDEARDEFREALEDCERITPREYLLGYSEENYPGEL